MGSAGSSSASPHGTALATAIRDDAVVSIPPLVLLGYSDRRPFLRVVRLDDRSVEPAPVSLDGVEGLSSLLIRDGWIAARAHHEVWTVPLPLGEGRAEILAESFDCEPDRDGMTVWLEADDGSGTFVRVNGLTRTACAQVELGKGTRIDAVVPAGFVVRRGTELALVDNENFATEPIGSGHVQASYGNVILVGESSGGLALYDLDSASRTEVDDPGVGRWQRFASFSPHGQSIAIGADRDPPRPLPEQTDWANLPPYEGSPSCLVLIDVATGKAVIAEGSFDNFAWTPVWSSDGEWLVFGAPYESKQLWLMSFEKRVLQRVRFRRQPPMPLLDVTHLPWARPDIEGA
jgi:hypothetical protein